MKSIVLLIYFIACTSLATFSQVKIGNNPNTIDPSAILELESTDKGLIIPRMTSSERQGIASPAEGLLVFDNSTGTFWYYNSFGWNEMVLTTVVYNSTLIQDNDADTWIVTEQNPDDDTIRIGIAGTERYRFTSRSIDQVNNGRSVFLGENAGKHDDATDNENAFAGYRAGYQNLSGNYNTALGAYSLLNNAAQNNLVAVGHSAMRNNGTGAVNWWEGTDNTAVGSQSLYSNTVGYNNSGLGYGALYTNTNGNHNTAIGGYSLNALNGGSFNSAFGAYSMFNLQLGFWNTAMGFEALYSNTSSSFNVAIGYQAMRQGTTASNTAVGSWSLYSQLGANNTAVGYYALYGSTGTGSNNVAVGYEALKANTNGYYNTVIGTDAMEANTTGSWNVAIGSYAAGLNQGGSYNIAVGASALSNNLTGSDNTAVGAGSGPDVGNPGLTYTTTVGRYALATADNQVRIGHAGIGSIGGYQNWSNISDGRFKRDVSEAVPGLEFILQLRPLTYYLDVDKLNHHLGLPDSVMTEEAFARTARQKSQVVQTGFIAQEVEQAALEIGYDFSGVDAPKNEHDLYGLRYAEFVVPLVKAIQEQQAMIENLQKRVEQQNEMIKKLLK